MLGQLLQLFLIIRGNLLMKGDPHQLVLNLFSLARILIKNELLFEAQEIQGLFSLQISILIFHHHLIIKLIIILWLIKTHQLAQPLVLLKPPESLHIRPWRPHWLLLLQRSDKNLVLECLVALRKSQSLDMLLERHCLTLLFSRGFLSNLLNDDFLAFFPEQILD